MNKRTMPILFIVMSMQNTPFEKEKWPKKRMCCLCTTNTRNSHFLLRIRMFSNDQEVFITKDADEKLVMHFNLSPDSDKKMSLKLSCC